MNQIILKVKAIDWSCGNIGYVWILLDGGSCNIDWGDNHTSSIRVPPYSKEPVWLGDAHAYPRSCMASADEYNIIISSANDNIIGIDADSGDMNVEDVDIKECQSIKYFKASHLISHFDLRTNPGIEKVYLEGEACGIADFSNSTELKELSFCHTGGRSEKVKKLNLARCDKLEYLECRYAYDLTHIAISNRSALKKLVYNDNTPLSEKSLEIIRRIITGNGGVIEYDDTE